MATPRNPFKPTFGSTPPLLVGRAEIIDEFATGLDDGPGAPGRYALYSGLRGTGKTVMLNAAEDQARQRGWLVISETAVPGMIRRLIEESLPALLSQQDPDAVRRHLTGFSLPANIGASWAADEQHRVTPGLRDQLRALCAILEQHGTGLLITVDELHYDAVDELREFGAALQHMVREEREFAFAGAGLPTPVEDLLKEHSLTFLQRADQHALGAVSRDEVEVALREPIIRAGRKITPEALTLAADATGGYPFMIQLVGHRIWRQNPTATTIASEAAVDGTAEARRRVGALVYGTQLKQCSEVDRTFLVAMAQSEDDPTPMKSIQAFMDVSGVYAGVYRDRLIKLGLVEAAGHGLLRFTAPYLREYLREQATSLL